MYQQINEQFAAASRQFADAAVRAQRLALDNAEAVVGLQLAAFEQNAAAGLAWLEEAGAARDFEALKAVSQKGVQIARENTERALGVGREVLERNLKTGEALAGIAKTQAESAVAQAREGVDEVTKAAAKAARAK
ncbi:phasin family protein [Luteimonas pelagia]